MEQAEGSSSNSRTTDMANVSQRRRAMLQRRRRANESEEVHEERLSQRREADLRRRANESEEVHEERLSQRREADLRRRTNVSREVHQEQLSQRREADQRRRTNASQETRDQQLSQRRRADQGRRNARPRTYGKAVNKLANVDEASTDEHYIGPITSKCDKCGALHFGQKPKSGTFNICCANGKVSLPPIESHPTIVSLLSNRDNPNYSHFRQSIRRYNSALACASMGANVKPPPGNGPYCFRIQGSVYHVSGPLHPRAGDAPAYGQLYILDQNEATEIRMLNSELQRQLTLDLSNLLQSINPAARAYRMMHEVENDQRQLYPGDTPAVRMTIVRDVRDDQRRYNAQQANEIAMVFVSDDGEVPTTRDLMVHKRSTNRTERISLIHGQLDTMTYPIFFPYGFKGFTDGLEYCQRTGKRGTMSMLEFYNYYLAMRDSFNPIHYGGRLMQQFVVDIYCKIEASRLLYLQLNQKKFRHDNLRNLREDLANEPDGMLGREVVLPSSFEGSERNYSQRYLDAMAICSRFGNGKADLFITITCNPNWIEISENLLPGQTAADRPDLVAKVFKLKLAELIQDISVKQVLGKCIAFIYSIEFQKRGLPHAHILLILAEEDKLKTADQVDEVVCAEIPAPDTHPRLHNVIIKNMIHGPCGKLNPTCICMQDGKCKKKFPKPFREMTDVDQNSYPEYRRRDSKVSYQVRGCSVDNSWVVPYNPYLSLKYNCHLNVEICASIKSAKYLFKYVYKGHDRANVQIQQNDGLNPRNEVQQHLDARYVGPVEACWRLNKFSMHGQSHSVQRLIIHLPGQQSVRFEDDGNELELHANAAMAADGSEDNDDTLTAWFKLNLEDSSAREYLYTQIPEQYTFVKSRRGEEQGYYWKRRVQACKTIGRMYNIGPNAGELYYLRMLLLHIRGATCFEYLRTVDDELCDTFKEACIKHHLLEDDSEWDRCLTEAVATKMPGQIRELFALICAFNQPTSPLALWEKHRDAMVEDYVHRNLSFPYDRALHDIQDVLMGHGKFLQDFNLPQPVNVTAAEKEIDAHACQQEAARRGDLIKRNPKQAIAFNKVMAAVKDDNSPDRLFFVDGPGGSGKTFLYEALYYETSGLQLHVDCVASTGIAATLLPFGRTAHSAFKIPIPVHAKSASSLRPTSKAGKALRDTKLILWDECTMTQWKALDLVDKILRECSGNDRPFGGKVLLLGGDFRQCLVVVPKGNRAQIIGESIFRSKHWPKFQYLELTTNMRVRNDDGTHRDWLLKLGNGTLKCDIQEPADIIEVPTDMVEDGNLIDRIFGKRISVADVQHLSSRAILAPKNEDVFKMNEEILNRLEGPSRVYLSADSISSDNPSEARAYPIEYLHGLTPSGMALHKLELKVGAIVMLLRNLCSARGLCNGTRLIIEKMEQNLIIAKVLTGRSKDQTVFIPRINLVPAEGNCPVPFKRRQFPLATAFCMTINKSQGQQFTHLGILLPSEVFSHGQLYVAFSRGQYREYIWVKVINTGSQGKLIKNSNRVFTRNVVYGEVFEEARVGSDDAGEIDVDSVFWESDSEFDNPMDDWTTLESPSETPSVPMDADSELWQPDSEFDNPMDNWSTLDTNSIPACENDMAVVLGYGPNGIEYEPAPHPNTHGPNVFDIHGNLLRP